MGAMYVEATATLGSEPTTASKRKVVTGLATAGAMPTVLAGTEVMSSMSLTVMRIEVGQMEVEKVMVMRMVVAAETVDLRWPC